METISINPKIFRELIKRGYSSEGKKKVWNIADSKLWYLKPEQAQSFVDLEGSKKYMKCVIQNEIDLINQNFKEIISSINSKNINLVDIGCGDGKKAALLVKKLKGKLKMRYCPVDISSYMVEKAVQRIKKASFGKTVKIKWNVSNFENLENISEMLRYKKFQENFFLMLGNTLGGFEINEILYDVRKGMVEGDHLLIGNSIKSSNNKEILEVYDTPEMNNFLEQIPLQLGLKKSEIKFGVRFRNSRVEVYYTIQKDRELSYVGEKVKFKKGDQIIVFVSYKYSQEELKSLLNMYFSEVDLKISKDNSYVLAFCRK